MYSISRWQKINFKTSQFNHFAFCRKSMTYDGHNVAKVFFVTCPTNPIWVRVQRIPSFFLSYCKQKYYNHFCKGWGFMLQNQGNMPWWMCVWMVATAPTTSNDALTRPSNIMSVPVSDPSHKSWGLGVKESHIGNLTTSSGAPRRW